jgi:hypothetical protein
MIKVHILTTCTHCDGESYVSVDEAENYISETCTRYAPCLLCQNSDPVAVKRASRSRRLFYYAVLCN